ncbi:hypothetical protein Xszus_03395 [Xenorhabdus szentirmaii]|uniref:Uncharacterized protein n=1 Tax=Xenorhabdus szentirmaii DSM 16338 TaxID=1427518 RepID=W1J1Y7_9GAMM|nr:hypothetical protein Xsze_01282 [Xenorhabdus szentirmaii DSM 16338]PHM43595.1 hypothetical protein Xszus_03395 [Xenorhabdus szentirmaii]CDL84772.1 hypothetical protein XSR1_510009 [Xenorhabdus szentirmaii DSM 16338]
MLSVYGRSAQEVAEMVTKQSHVIHIMEEHTLLR